MLDHYDMVCYLNTAKDHVYHSDACSEMSLEAPEEPRSPCGAEDQVERLRKILKLEMISVWPLVLDDPRLARGNNLLSDEWIYSSRYVGRHTSGLFEVVADELIFE